MTERVNANNIVYQLTIISISTPQISDVHKEGCTLKWNPPVDDGGAPIDHYLVEKLDTETGRWMPALKTKDPKAEVENLVPGHEYKFRVSAVNNEGVSEPLEADHSIIAKNPFGKLSFVFITKNCAPLLGNNVHSLFSLWKMKANKQEGHVAVSDYLCP